MAVVFTTDISTTDLLLAYTNNVVRFNSDSASAATKATITIGAIVKTIYPHPDNTFYFNFKELITSIINTDNFEDGLDLDISGSGYVYDWSKVYLNNDIVFAITLSNFTTETVTKNISFISATVDYETFKSKFPFRTELNTPKILSVSEKDSNNSAYLKYWTGYPFDIAVYSGDATTLKITNLDTTLHHTFNTVSEVNRYAFSDGNTTITIEDVLPLSNGFNDLKLTANDLDYYATLEQINENCESIYLKWSNDNGGYNYWLFANGNRDRKTNDLGEINNDYNNLGDTISPTIQIGKNSNDIIKIESDILTEQENNLLSGILDCPKIYLFTGQRFAKAGYNDWLEVSIPANNYRVSNAKQIKNKIAITLELPKRNTRKI
jgi:hypothetical protein